MNWRKITFVVVALIILLGGSYALSRLFVSLKPEPPRRPATDAKRFVKVETVKYTDVVSPLNREGRVVSGNEVLLVSQAAGEIEKGKLALKKGASFKKGQLLAVIYKDEAELALKAKKSSFLNSLTNILPDLKVDFPTDYSKYLEFFNKVGLEKELPKMPEVTSENLKIFLASRNILAEYYGIKQDEKKLSRYSLYAPFDGTFTQVNFEVGAFVNTGAQIAKMIRTDVLEIEVPVENYQSEWIRIGDIVEVYSRNRDNMVKGKVVRKSNFVEQTSQARSIFVKVGVKDSENLLVGEFMMVNFPGQVISEAMEMPRSAVFNTNEVYTVVNGKLKKAQVQILKWNEETVIFKGLEAGTKLVVEPLINVFENSSVGILGDTKVGQKKMKGE